MTDFEVAKWLLENLILRVFQTINNVNAISSNKTILKKIQTIS